MSQTDLILRHLKRGGTLTHLAAFNLYKTTRLAARVYDLKKRGVKVKSQRVHLDGRRTIARYYIAA